MGTEGEEEMRSEWRAMVVLMVLALAAAIGRVAAQQQLQDCFTQLRTRLNEHCQDAIQSPTTDPSANCCNDMLAFLPSMETKCLCALYNSPSTVAPYNLNGTRIQDITRFCKLSVQATCQSVSISYPGPTPPTSTPSSSPPAASPPTPTPSSSPPAPSNGLSPQANTPIAPIASSPSPSNGTSHNIPGPEKSESRKPPVVIVVISMLIVALITCVICGLCWWKRVFCFTWRRKKLKTGKLSEEEEERLHKSEHQVFNGGNAMDGPTFNLATIKLATEDFALTNKLGEGGFSTVYKGKLPGGQEIAVKRLSRNTGQGPTQFDNEVQTLAVLQHKNLVRLLGGFQEDEEKILVYEYVPNGSLDNFLFGEPEQRMKLDWGVRSRLINGIARGLLYLHEDSRLKIIHRDLKASNILLDEGMNPKISDFGTAKIFDTDQTLAETIVIMGTRGYIAPEYLFEGKVSVKVDVFSFGVLLLEIMSGKKNLSSINQLEENESLLDCVWRLWGENKALEIVDDQILLEGTSDKDEMLRCIHLGLMCVQEDVSRRPKMSKVVAILENSSLILPSITVPPTWKNKNFFWGQRTSSTMSEVGSEHGSSNS